eukprot:gene13878-15326_t
MARFLSSAWILTAILCLFILEMTNQFSSSARGRSRSSRYRRTSSRTSVNRSSASASGGSLGSFLLPVVCILQIMIPLMHIYVCKCRQKSKCRTLSMHAYITFVLWLTYCSVCSYTHCTQYGQVLSDFLIMSIVMIIASYVYILFESCGSAEYQIIHELPQDESIMDVVNSLKRKRVERNMIVECWHMETRPRSVDDTDSNGDAKSKTETYQEKVVTYRENKPFLYDNCEDMSYPEEGLQFHRKGVACLKLLKDVECGDDETMDRFNEMKQEMITRNERRDANITFSFEDTIPGFEKRICAYADTNQKAWWMNLSCYWLSTVFLCSWPFRVMFNWKTTKAEYTIKKRLFISSPPEGLSTPWLAPDLPRNGSEDAAAQAGVLYDGVSVNLPSAPFDCPPPSSTTIGNQGFLNACNSLTLLDSGNVSDDNLLENPHSGHVKAVSSP